MSGKTIHLNHYIAAILLSLIALSGCGTVASISSDIAALSQPAIDTDANLPPPIGTLSHSDEDFQVTFNFPEDWALVEESLNTSATSRVLRLQKGTRMLVIWYKFIWDNTDMGGNLPTSDIVDRGRAILLDRAVSKYVVVHENKDKVLF